MSLLAWIVLGLIAGSSPARSSAGRARVSCWTSFSASSAQTILDQLPEAVSKLSAGLASLRMGQGSTMQKVQTAASEFERATSQEAGVASTPKQPATRVVIDPPGFKLGNFLWAGSMGAAGLVG